MFANAKLKIKSTYTRNNGHGLFSSKAREKVWSRFSHGLGFGVQSRFFFDSFKTLFLTFFYQVFFRMFWTSRQCYWTIPKWLKNNFKKLKNVTIFKIGQSYNLCSTNTLWIKWLFKMVFHIYWTWIRSVCTKKLDLV